MHLSCHAVVVLAVRCVGTSEQKPPLSEEAAQDSEQNNGLVRTASGLR